MKEASFWIMTKQLRRLFMRILLYCSPLHPTELRKTFKHDMSADFNRFMNLEKIQRKAFLSISAMMHVENRSISDYIDDNVMPI